MFCHVCDKVFEKIFASAKFRNETRNFCSEECLKKYEQKYGKGNITINDNKDHTLALSKEEFFKIERKMKFEKKEFERKEHDILS